MDNKEKTTNNEPQYVQPTSRFIFQEFSNSQYYEKEQNPIKSENAETQKPVSEVKPATEEVKKEEVAKAEEPVTAKKPQKKGLKGFTKTIYVLVQTILLLTFISGISVVNGKPVNALTFVFKILILFDFRFLNWFYYVSNVAQGVIYLIFLIFIIKDYIASIKYWKWGTVDSVSMYSRSILRYCMIYFIISFAFSKVELSSFALVALIGCVLLLCLAFIMERKLEDKVTLDFLLSSPVAFIVKILAFSLVMNFLMEPFLYKMIHGLSTLKFIDKELPFLTNVHIIYDGLGTPILGFILMSFLIYVASSAVSKGFTFDSEYLSWADERDYWKRLLILIIIMLAINMFFYFASANTSADTVYKILDFLVGTRKNLLPCLIISLFTYIFVRSLKPERDKKYLTKSASKIKY
ncbi:MAG: hypothetical protein IJA97_02380 [Clostridia bacterium]|nr:hypothetical protein [Clostridia bacterium]